MQTLPLSLPLLVARVRADHIDFAVSSYDLALIADTTNTGAYFHRSCRLPNESNPCFQGGQSILGLGTGLAREKRRFSLVSDCLFLLYDRKVLRGEGLNGLDVM